MAYATQRPAPAFSTSFEHRPPLRRYNGLSANALFSFTSPHGATHVCPAVIIVAGFMRGVCLQLSKSAKFGKNAVNHVGLFTEMEMNGNLGLKSYLSPFAVSCLSAFDGVWGKAGSGLDWCT